RPLVHTLILRFVLLFFDEFTYFSYESEFLQLPLNPMKDLPIPGSVDKEKHPRCE
ncbi:unnamed protein product, partial [Allacma fusca]